MSQLKLFGGKSSRSASRTAPRTAKKNKKPTSALKRITTVLVILAVLEGMYFTCVYSNNAFISKWRSIYIQTAMSTMRHQWLATALIPRNVIDEVMAKLEDAQAKQDGLESKWDAETAYPGDDLAQEMALEGMSKEQIAFYKLFWELDRDSMQAYVTAHPEVVANGWNNLKINESALNQDGTTIQTTMGEQVLAIDAAQQVLLLRVKGSGYRGVLAVAKDPARLSVQNTAMPGAAGQTAGVIAQNHGGILSMTGSGFIDNGGTGNGGILAGYAMSDGDGGGAHMGWSYKRLELREDNLMYITDAQSPVHPDTTDAVEFTPALIVDGEVIVDSNSGWTAVNPRAAIGQSEKKEILMLVIEGRLVDSLGTDVMECARILKQHNAMQAMNLDGGTSAILWYDGNYVTRCSNQAIPEGRTLPNAFVFASN